jgi:hypothetical protein
MTNTQEASAVTKARKERGPNIDKDTVIRINVTVNPKREGSLAHARFALYEDGMTIEEYIAAGGRSSDVHYDQARGDISFEAATAVEEYPEDVTA